MTWLIVYGTCLGAPWPAAVSGDCVRAVEVAAPQPDRGDMKSLSGLDAVFLHLETAHTPMHVASLCLFDLPGGDAGRFHARIKRELRRRLHLASVLHRRLAPMPLGFANPVWIDDDAVDLDHHVQRVTLPPPGSIAQLEDCAAALHAQPLDRKRPLWQAFVIDGLAGGQVGYYFKAHHAALDGQAGMLLMQAMFDTSPRRRTIPRPDARLEAAPPPGAIELATAALGHDLRKLVDLVRRLPAAARAIAGLLGPSQRAGKGRLDESFAIGPRTALNVQIGAECSFASLSLPLHSLRELADALGVKLNDVVLALCSGALRRYLARHGGVPRKPLIAAMPISLRDAGDTDYTIRATMPPVNLHTNIAEPLRRLRAIQAAAGAVKTMVRQARSALPLDFPSIGMPWVLRGLAGLYGRSHVGDLTPPVYNVVISNVHGPDMPLYLAGARMRGIWPMSIVEHGLGLNITMSSYAGEMGFGFTAARAAVPDPHELTQALADAFDELAARAAPARTRPAVRTRQAGTKAARRS